MTRFAKGLAPVFGLIVALWSAMATGASAQTLLRDAEIEAYLRDYTNPLLEAANISPSSVDLYLVGDPSLNAFVGGGLNMFVHTGLITAADNPNQIQGVLAHETGHLSGGHQQRGAEAFSKALGRPAILSLVLGAAAIAAGAPPEAGIAITGLGQTIGMAEATRYSRGQEAAADQAAVSLLEDVGASGEGLVEFFYKLSNLQLTAGREPIPYMQTHPLPIQRVSILREQVAEKEHYNDRDSEAEIFRLKMIQAKIHGFMEGPQTTLRRYPLSDRSEPALYARAVAYYRSSLLDNALRDIDRLIEAEPKNPFFYELKGQMLFEHGKILESVEPHRNSVTYGPSHALLKINLARSLNALGNDTDTEEAIELLKVALQMEPDNGFGWSELARAYASVDDTPRANLAQAQAFYAWGNPAEAHRFATRAKDQLEPGTPEHLQALDILAASEQGARQARR